MGATVKYNNNVITTLFNETKKLTTSGKWMESDIEIEDTGATALVVDTPDAGGGTIKSITVTDAVNLQGAKSVAYDGQQITVTPDTGYDGFSSVVIYERRDLCVAKDVDFIDYDGRLLYSYTAAEFLELTELPPNPTNAGLVAQGWNQTLEDAQEFVAKYGAQVIGQNYTTDDGKTRLYIEIPNDYIEYGKSVQINYHQNTIGSCVISWGDGESSTMTVTTTGNKSTKHRYTAPGSYIIEIEVVSGSIRLGYWGANLTVMSSDFPTKMLLKKVEIGDGVIGLCRNTFDNLPFLKSVSIPITCINHDTGNDYAIFNGQELTGIVFPAGTPGQNTRIVGNGGNMNAHIKYISIPKSMNGFMMNSPYMRSLRKLIFYDYSTSSTLQAYLYDASYCTHFIVPGTYTTITTDRCRASLIKNLIIPETVTSISATAFVYNGNLVEVHLLPTTPPTMGNVNAFGSANANLVFYVPYSEDHSILEAYQTATNWSTYAAKMQEEPQS